MRATPLSAGAPPGATRAVIRRVGDEAEMVNLRWGFRPAGDNAAGQRFLRSEGRSFPSHRCLLPASEFQIVNDGRPYRVTLSSGDWFYLPGIWRSADGDWPEAFAILTVDANREVSRYQARQGALIPRGEQMAWLDHSRPESELLVTPPRGIFTITPALPVQGQLAF